MKKDDEPDIGFRIQPEATDCSIALGENAAAKKSAIAVGRGAKATGPNSIAIGHGVEAGPNEVVIAGHRLTDAPIDLASKFRLALKNLFNQAIDSMVRRPLVVIESPFAGDEELNLRYLRSCMRDCLMRGEAPYASHGLYTQPGVLEDKLPEERKLSMEAGFAWGSVAEKVAVYMDLGVTEGMRKGIELARERGQEIEHRNLDTQTLYMVYRYRRRMTE